MKKIKLYLHHNHFESTSIKDSGARHNVIVRFVKGIGAFVYEGLYLVGAGVIGAAKSPQAIVRSTALLPRKLGNIKALYNNPAVLRTVVIFSCFTFIIGSVMYGAGVGADGLRLKARVLGVTDEGIQYLQSAGQALSGEDVSQAQQNFSKALEKFEKSEQEMTSGSKVLTGILQVVPQKRDADKLLNAAQLMTEAAIDATKAYQLSQTLKASPQGLVSEGGDTQFSLERLNSLITSGTNKTLEAKQLIDEVGIGSIPEDKRPAFIDVKDLLTVMEGNMLTLRDISSMLISVASGNQDLLLVFQNNNELRTSGGFIGTVGKARISAGSIKSLDIRSVYDFDGQMHDWVTPPKPIMNINERWYLRDANWFVDFRQSAQSIIHLYEAEGGETPDLVVAVTPDLIIDLLTRIGPIELPQYNVTLTAENFIETVQTSTSVAYSKELNQPKQLLADFFPILMQKLSAQPQGLVSLLEILQKSLFEKNILLYSTHEDLQTKIESFNWGGQVAESSRDFLMIASSNMGGTKTDLSLDKTLRLDSEIDSTGKITNTISYTVVNPLPNQNGLQNINYIRFLIPKNSKLISSEGFIEIKTPDLPQQDYKTYDEVKIWADNLQYDNLSYTHIGNEANKTFFGGWIEVKGGESKTIRLKYELPFKHKSTDRHALTLQKQPGVNNLFIQYKLNFPGRGILWKNFTESGSEENSISAEGQLLTDKYLGLVLKDLN